MTKWCSVLVLAGAASACDTHYTDIIVQVRESPDGSGEGGEGGAAGSVDNEGGDAGGPARDPCSGLDGEACGLDTEHGCSLQPNPTGCLSTDPSCGPGTCAGGDPFVRRSGEALFLHGAPFTFIGTVSWGLAFAEDGCKLRGYASQEQALDDVMDRLAGMHLSVLRFYAFQKYAGASGTDYSHFERLVEKARAAGIRLLPVLEDVGSGCSVGPGRDDAWFAAGYKSPYGGYALSYRDYVVGVVTRFRDEPTILGWELMNEAAGNDFAALDTFTADMSKLVRDIDPNHLISLGLNTGDSAATSSAKSIDRSNSHYYELQNRDEVDLIDLHDFNRPEQPAPAQSIACAEIAHALGKALFVGAAAIKLESDSAAALQTRARQMENKLAAAMAGSARGFLVYDFVPDWSAPNYDFDTRSEDPLAGPDGVLNRYAPRYGRPPP